MSNGYIFDRIGELKDKFRLLVSSKCKVRALENYFEVFPSSHAKYLELIKRCMNDGFIGEEEVKFLDHIIDKYFSEDKYLDWAWKSRWLKKKIAKMKVNEPVNPIFRGKTFSSWTANFETVVSQNTEHKVTELKNLIGR